MTIVETVKGWHVCKECGETVYCHDKKCDGMPGGLCHECYLKATYNHELKV